MLKKLWVISLFVFNISLIAQTDSTQTTDSNTNEKDISQDTSYTFINEINAILNIAEKQKGAPYVYGGCRPGGFDCSGFVLYCFQQAVNVQLPHASGSISSMGTKISTKNARPGDIIYFTGRRINGRTGHVGIVYEVNSNGIYFIHASTSEGVRINKTTDNYWNGRFLGIRRILH